MNFDQMLIGRTCGKQPDMDGKKTDEITVKLSSAGKCFVVNRAKQLEFESAAEYIRHLVEMDQAKAASDFNLLAEALGLKVIQENLENQR